MICAPQRLSERVAMATDGDLVQIAVALCRHEVTAVAQPGSGDDDDDNDDDDDDDDDEDDHDDDHNHDDAHVVKRSEAERTQNVAQIRDLSSPAQRQPRTKVVVVVAVVTDVTRCATTFDASVVGLRFRGRQSVSACESRAARVRVGDAAVGARRRAGRRIAAAAHQRALAVAHVVKRARNLLDRHRGTAAARATAARDTRVGRNATRRAAPRRRARRDRAPAQLVDRRAAVPPPIDVPPRVTDDISPSQRTRVESTRASAFVAPFGYETPAAARNRQ